MMMIACSLMNMCRSPPINIMVATTMIPAASPRPVAISIYDPEQDTTQTRAIPTGEMKRP